MKSQGMGSAQNVQRLASPGAEQGHYKGVNSTKRDARMITHKSKGAKLAPVMAHNVKQNESGSLRQTVAFEIDPVMGRFITVPKAKVISIFVPMQALHALRYPEHAYPGSHDAVKQLILSEAPLFDLEAESELSQRLSINPRSIDGTPMVCSSALIAHNCAVNYLRRRKYHKAAQLTHDNRDMQPALYDRNVLERFGGVLDPDERINGSVDLDLTGRLEVKAQNVNTGTGFPGPQQPLYAVNETIAVANQGSLDFRPFADLGDADGAVLSLRDMFVAERSDRLIRVMDEIVHDNPEYGEEMLAEWSHGLDVDPGKQPIVLFERTIPVNRALTPGMDGAAIVDRTEVTNMSAQIEFAVPIPRTKFGGVIITFASFLPDEVIQAQPHPEMTVPWVGENFTLDELKLDPQPVTVRDLYSDCDQADEETVMFFTGNNHMRRTYMDSGFARYIDDQMVENKNAIWREMLPLSVNPTNVHYPETVEQYPWPDQLADICTMHVRTLFIKRSPTIMGPSPVEQLTGIDLTPADE